MEQATWRLGKCSVFPGWNLKNGTATSTASTAILSAEGVEEATRKTAAAHYDAGDDVQDAIWIVDELHLDELEERRWTFVQNGGPPLPVGGALPRVRPVSMTE